MTYIKVTADELQSVSTQLSSAAQTINDANTSALGQVNGLIGAGWEGAASAQFEALFQSWQQGAIQVQESLAAISQLLSGAGRAYTDNEERIRQSMTQG